MKLMEPFQTTLDMQTGILQPAGQIMHRHLSDMGRMYADADAANRILQAEGDRLIYEVYGVDLPEEEGQVLHSTTIIYPGRVGEEFHMTKGHYHERRDRAELYLGLAGQGYLILQADGTKVLGVPMGPGTMAYVPPMWAHRTANIGGFAKLLVDRGSGAVLVDNPGFREAPG
jgi:glucose-6-phosphate isomerase